MSALGLASPKPLDWAGVAIVQLTYKLIFLAWTIAPLVARAAWSAFPLVPTLIFASYVPLLLATIPWSHLFPGGIKAPKLK